MARVDYDAQAGRYDRGRGIGDAAMAVWMASARRHFGDVGRILDLGSGTGRFSAALADALDADVLGVEPSAGMRGRAAAKPHPKVTVLAGGAEDIPLTDASVDGVWLSNVIHHFDDFPKAAREIRRVLEANGTVYLRGAIGGKPVPSLYRFFPATQAVIDTFPSMPQIVATFQDAGFGSFYSELISYELAPNLSSMLERVRLRADTTLEKISDEDFERGLAQMEEATNTETGPVVDHLDVVVMR
ncbi:MAG: class I SAM-dependent methyltransferase [Actinomycetota bacterium]